MKKITIKDIANYCGVSITTVSWVLNGKTKELGEETIEKVQNAIKELGYTRNEVARSLVTNRSRTIAFIIPDITNLFYASIIKAANEVAVKNGYNILLCNTDNSLEAEIQQIKSLDNRLIDGVVIASRNAKKVLNNFENNRSVPIVVIDEQADIGNSNTMMVYTDNLEAAKNITNYIIENGHRKIFILGGLEDSTNTEIRYKGVLEALKMNGMTEEDILFKHANYQRLLAYQITKEYFSEKFTAILAFNDLMAYGALSALNEMKIENVSVAGFDANTTLSLFNELTEYDLTSINQDENQIGEIALTQIINELENNGKHHKKATIIPAHLHIGNTVMENRMN